MQARFVSLVVVIALGLCAILGVKSASAAGVVGNGTPGSCTEAAFVAALAGGGQITFNCGSGPHTITLTSSKRIANTTSIDGGGLISLSGGNTSGIFYVNSDVTLNLANITLRDTGAVAFSIGTTLFNGGTTNLVNTTFINNNFLPILNEGGTLSISGSRFEGNTSSGYGGAISNEGGGTATIQDSTFINNRAPSSYSGGAISNSAKPSTMTIARSSFSDNVAGAGGALSNYGTMTVSDSTFNGNTAADSGGAIYAATNAELNAVNTTISGNMAKRGGGIVGSGPNPTNAATLTNVTIANNTTPADGTDQGGGNIALLGEASITLRNTIVANPGGSSSNCRYDGTGGGTFINGGNNLQFPGTTCGSAITTADPKLGALADNGGLTQTQAIAADSPARNTANSSNCPGFDQRGVVRPQAGICDIGAFEYGAVPTPSKVNTICARVGQSFTITATGTNFIVGNKGSRIILNGTALATTVVSPTQLTAIVPAGLLTGAPGSTATVAVQTPVVDGGTSNSLPFTICYNIYIPFVQK